MAYGEKVTVKMSRADSSDPENFPFDEVEFKVEFHEFEYLCTGQDIDPNHWEGDFDLAFASYEWDPINPFDARTKNSRLFRNWISSISKKDDQDYHEDYAEIEVLAETELLNRIQQRLRTTYERNRKKNCWSRYVRKIPMTVDGHDFYVGVLELRKDWGCSVRVSEVINPYCQVEQPEKWNIFYNLQSESGSGDFMREVNHNLKTVLDTEAEERQRLINQREKRISEAISTLKHELVGLFRKDCYEPFGEDVVELDPNTIQVKLYDVE